MRRKLLLVVISNMFYFHPYLGKIPILAHIFQMGWNHQLVNNVSKIPDVNVNVCKLRVPCTSVISASYSHNTMFFPGKTIVLEGTHFSRCCVVTTYPSQIDLCLCITITILSNFVKGQIYQILQSFQMQHMFFILERCPTWRIISVSKWLVTPIYKPFRPFVRGTTLLRGLTNHGY